MGRPIGPWTPGALPGKRVSRESLLPLQNPVQPLRTTRSAAVITAADIAGADNGDFDEAHVRSRSSVLFERFEDARSVGSPVTIRKGLCFGLTATARAEMSLKEILYPPIRLAGCR